MLEELKKNANWTLKDISMEKFPEVAVKSTSNTQGKKLTLKDVNADALKRAVDWYKNPDKFYEAKKEKVDTDIVKLRYDLMVSLVKNYYHAYAGKNFVWQFDTRCEEVNLYEVKIPDGEFYYQIESKNPPNGIRNYYNIRRLKGGEFFVMCDGLVGYDPELVDIYMEKRKKSSLKDGKDFVWINPGPDDIVKRYEVSPVRTQDLPKKLIKTFKMEYYLDKRLYNIFLDVKKKEEEEKVRLAQERERREREAMSHSRGC